MIGMYELLSRIASTFLFNFILSRQIGITVHMNCALSPSYPARQALESMFEGGDKHIKAILLRSLERSGLDLVFGLFVLECFSSKKMQIFIFFQFVTQKYLIKR